MAIISSICMLVIVLFVVICIFAVLFDSLDDWYLVEALGLPRASTRFTFPFIFYAKFTTPIMERGSFMGKRSLLMRNYWFESNTLSFNFSIIFKGDLENGQLCTYYRNGVGSSYYI